MIVFALRVQRFFGQAKKQTCRLGLATRNIQIYFFFCFSERPYIGFGLQVLLNFQTTEKPRNTKSIFILLLLERRIQTHFTGIDKIK
jgi:hypothetical protein